MATGDSLPRCPIDSFDWRPSGLTPSDLMPFRQSQPDAASEQGGRPMKKVIADSFRSDPMFPHIERAVDELLAKSNVVAPVDVLVGMGLMRSEHLAEWRRGQIAYLERVITCNLSRVSRILRILRFHAHDLNLKPSFTDYNRHDKGAKQRLRFSKTGDPNLEKAYATHLIRQGARPSMIKDRQPADE